MLSKYDENRYIKMCRINVLVQRELNKWAVILRKILYKIKGGIN